MRGEAIYYHETLSESSPATQREAFLTRPKGPPFGVLNNTPRPMQFKLSVRVQYYILTLQEILGTL